MDSDEEDFVFYGTPIERAEDMSSRKKKSVAEAAGNLRTLPPWKQEVTDEEGRRRFHGAFTGGYSAGYYNTVGSKEGWTPQPFTSSRKNRAEVKQQDILNFLDDDEKAEMEGNRLSTSMQFDTFGFTAAEFARKQADKEQKKRPSAIPGPVPDELVLPATNSIGVKMLLKMGWRHGHSIRDSRTNSLYDARREARKAFLALSSDDAERHRTQIEPNESDHKGVSEQSIDDVVHTSQATPVFVLNPKEDLHGLGYDPFRHAPEFRERKRLRVPGNREPGDRTLSVKESIFASKSGKVAAGFGIGALEELDDEDEDVYASGYNFEETYVQDIEEPSNISAEPKRILGKAEQSVLPGFKLASNADFQTERFDPPVIPRDFEPHHRFPAALEDGNRLAGPPPLDVSPPVDGNLRLLIDGFAALVARCGKLFEDLSKEKHKTNPLFCFLSGGIGHEYYARKLWEEQQKRTDQSKKPVDMISVPSVQKMTAESRGSILGERPLQRSSNDSCLSVASSDAIQLQFNLSDTFTKPASQGEFPEVAKPFKTDLAKQERFEQFLKDKYQGGLRSTDSGGNSNMSESDRARERLDFEAAAEAIQKAKSAPSTKLSSSQSFMEMISSANLQFTSGEMKESNVPSVEEQIIKKMYPKREEYQWRPSPILCKRFDIIDPYMGKPPPLPRPRGRIDSLIFTPDFVKTINAEAPVSASKDSVPAYHIEPQMTSELVTDMETANEPKNSNVERPVDLYKAIFSDDSDDEGQGDSSNQAQDSEKETEVANTTLNRLIAGDFLESLGKELGLEVPPEPLLTNNEVNISGSRKETVIASTSNSNRIPSDKDRPLSSLTALTEPSKDQAVTHCSLSYAESIQKEAFHEKELDHGSHLNIGREASASGQLKNSSDKVEPLNIASEVRLTKTNSKRHQSYSYSSSSEDKRSRRRLRRYRSRSSRSSSEDERSRTHSRRHGSKKGVSDSSSSDEHGSRSYSRSKEEKKDSSREKISKRKHSKHCSSRNKDSPSKSSRHGFGREHRREGKDGKKSGDRGRDLVPPKSDSHSKYRGN